MNLLREKFKRSEFLNDKISEELKEFSMGWVGASGEAVPNSSIWKKAFFVLIGIVLALTAAGAGFVIGYESRP